MESKVFVLVREVYKGDDALTDIVAVFPSRDLATEYKNQLPAETAWMSYNIVASKFIGSGLLKDET